VTGEIIIPSKSALMLARDGAIALTDDKRFLAVFNLTPATSLSIADVERRVFVGEIATPGCSLAYGAGERRYVMLCANGGILTVTVDEEGQEVSKVRTEGFFDPQTDPITEAAVRYADEWLFVSFDGIAHPLDVSAEPKFGQTWSLLTDSDRAEDWRIAGVQHLAVHEASGRLYSLVRQSEEPLDDPKGMDGQEVWVYDLQTRRRIARWAAVPETEDEQGPGGGEAAIGASSGDGAARILVTEHDEPLLVTVGADGVSVRDGMSGEYIHPSLTNAPAAGRLTAY
jgi:methylamine dehydrogenase heavy chain